MYLWSDLEFDLHATQASYEGHLAATWQQAYEFARPFKDEIEGRPDQLDYDWIPRSALIAACRRLNQGNWSPARPSQLADDAVIFPAARGGIDPDTGDNIRAVLTQAQRRRHAALLPL